VSHTVHGAKAESGGRHTKGKELAGSRRVAGPRLLRLGRFSHSAQPHGEGAARDAAAIATDAKVAYVSASMFLFTPRHVKQGRAIAKDARKLLAYKRDIWSETAVADFEAGIRKLEAAITTRDKRQISEAADELDKQAGVYVKPVTDAAWRENTEVFLVAIVIALAVRTYFLQPFTIPTGSMQPTLNGILGYKTETPPPNIAVRLLHTAVFGRTWLDVVAKDDEMIVESREFKRAGLLTRTEIVTDKNRYVVSCPRETLFRYFIGSMRPYKKGEVIARGYYDTGDHVFVDKMSYHFRTPKRGEVFVFNTQNIPTRENQATQMRGPSQYYIKRLAGVPGDELQIQPPRLLVNGAPAQGYGFQNVMSGSYELPNRGFRGYSNHSEQPSGLYRMNLLGAPEEKVKLPPKSYFALGDNSYHSSDSRDWGTVPEKNLMGRGVLVYWPFTRHWGSIR